jgi:hypothetical protein
VGREEEEEEGKDKGWEETGITLYRNKNSKKSQKSVP